MAEKKGTMIVIKKITVAGAGHHGGSWKVALADFMTALMAFFLVMWLLGQSEETKKAVSDYFSTPSIIEYNFENFGATVTLEKLFLDLANDPVKAIAQFLEPMSKSPDLLDQGSQKVVAAYLADQLSDLAKDVQVTAEGFEFDIPDRLLFERGTSKPTAQFLEIMNKLTRITTGLKEANIKITSNIYIQSIPDGTEEVAQKIAFQRLEIVKSNIKASSDDPTVSIKGGVTTKDRKGETDQDRLIGSIKVVIKQKEVGSDGKPRRKLEALFGDKAASAPPPVELRKPQSESGSGVRGQGSGVRITPIQELENPLSNELRKDNLEPTENQ